MLVLFYTSANASTHTHTHTHSLTHSLTHAHTHRHTHTEILPHRHKPKPDPHPEPHFNPNPNANHLNLSLTLTLSTHSLTHSLTHALALTHSHRYFRKDMESIKKSFKFKNINLLHWGPDWGRDRENFDLKAHAMSTYGGKRFIHRRSYTPTQALTLIPNPEPEPKP